MALRLLLVRHAKAVAAGHGVHDRDRPLSDRGRHDARALGRHLAGEGLQADLVLCSDAARARETMELIVDGWEQMPQVRVLPELYDQIDSDYFELIRDEAKLSVVMVVAHNPAIHATALALADASSGRGREMRRHFPTAATTVLDFDAAGWPAIGLGTGRVAAFLTPAA